MSALAPATHKTMAPAFFDNPVWNTLCTRHRRFSLGDERARCFAADISPFAGLRDNGEDCQSALTALAQRQGLLMLLQRDEIPVPEGLRAALMAEGVQMLATSPEFALEPNFQPLLLGEDDAAEMLALATLTKPGPFAARTHHLGQFYGLRIDGRLAAMAGMRMMHPGFTELSGVCTHPDFQGQGLARKLSAYVSRQIVASGDRPYLHAYAGNENAIRLYESLGYQLRARLQVAVLKPARPDRLRPRPEESADD